MRVLVTGAASGIGRAACLRIAADAQRSNVPAQIAALDRQPSEALDGVLDELHKLGARALALIGDVADPDEPGRLVGEATAAFGGLDGLVSNAGINRVGRLLDYSVADWDEMFAVNTRATWLLAKAAHGALTQGPGAIVATASMSGHFAHAGLGAYGPSKSALSMLVRVLAQEFAADGIRVNAVSPGMVQTGMTQPLYDNTEVAAARDALVPLGRVAQADDIADVIAFLLSSSARYVSGQDIIVDGALTGNMLGRLPGLAQIPRG